MTQIDIGPAVRQMKELVRNISDDEMKRATPCSETTVGDLLDHLSSFATGFTMAAKKQTEGLDRPPPKADSSRLGPDWRTRIPAELDGLEEAWRDPAAWTGMTKAGGRDFPGEVCGLIALDEVVVHGWDIARATDQPYDCEPELAEAAMQFVKPLAESGEALPGLFGPAVRVADGGSPLDRLLGMTGRDPAWAPPA